MKEILGDTFHNENLTIVGEKEFKDYFPNHITSSFTKDTFDQLEGFKHGNYVRYFNHPRTANLLDEYDINKCRTSCWLDNKLGSYEVFDCTSQVEVFDGTIKKGLYKIQCLDDAENFFVRGNTWYSGDFIQVGMQEGFKVLVNYQLLCKKENCLKATYFKEFVQKIINKYPNHYKHLINTCIGYRGKTNIKKKVGYIETDYDMACAAFWNNNDDQIGFLGDEGLSKKKHKMLKGQLCSVHALKVNEETEHYIVETETFKTLYDNDVPIFNKVLENEYLCLYKLKKALKCKPYQIIAIKTDAIVVEGKHVKIKLSEQIGGYKHAQKTWEEVTNYNNVSTLPKPLDLPKPLETEFIWNIRKEGEC